MSMRSDHKALLFLAAIAGLGAAVRVARAVGAAVAPARQPALEHQMQAADSAKRADAARRSARAGRKSSTRSRAKAPASAVSRASAAPDDGAAHRDYRGRLDLDAATAGEIDALPGVGPTLAKRIVVDRMRRGPFRELVALRRVKGISVKLLAQLDSLVSFSGISKPALASDTILPAKSSRKRR
jgi:competence protein ComEA